VLLIMLWVRSYYFVDALVLRVSERVGGAIDAEFGSFSFSWVNQLSNGNTWQTGIETAPARVSRVSPESWGFAVETFGDNAAWLVTVPCWSVVLLTATCAAMPWIRCFPRFSLRTLLIAMTVVAVGLAVLVMMSKGS
jgi:hypothetical protein